MKNFKTAILYTILLFINKIALADVDGLPPIKPLPPEKVIEITRPHNTTVELPSKNYGNSYFDGKTITMHTFNKTSTAGTQRQRPRPTPFV